MRGGTGSNKFAHELSVNLSAAKEAVKNERPPRLFVPEEKHAAPRILLQGADLFKFLRNDAGEPSVNKRSPPKKTQTLCSLHMVFSASVWYGKRDTGRISKPGNIVKAVEKRLRIE